MYAIVLCIPFCLQMEQNFSLIFGDAIAAKFWNSGLLATGRKSLNKAMASPRQATLKICFIKLNPNRTTE